MAKRLKERGPIGIAINQVDKLAVKEIADYVLAIINAPNIDEKTKRLALKTLSSGVTDARGDLGTVEISNVVINTSGES